MIPPPPRSTLRSSSAASDVYKRQEEMKLALLLNVIDPRIGGVMIMGDRGTGKSTTIRALADLLPAIEVVKDDPYNSSLIDPDLQSKEVLEKIVQGENLESTQKQVPMVDLPLGATEDRLCGTIDIEKALSEGVKAFEPGLLAKANRGLLYVCLLYTSPSPRDPL